MSSRSRSGWPVVLCMVLALGLMPDRRASAEEWRPLSKDGIHDPTVSALEALQEPGEALGLLPPGTAGDKVNWVVAIQNNYIQPRSHLTKAAKLETLDQDIVLANTRDMPRVIFPHRAHTDWLGCGDCHTTIFARKTGATTMNMAAILRGEYCGLCHGTVSFPLSECERCHSGLPGDAPEAAR